MRTITIGQRIFWARIHHNTGIYEVCELTVRTVYPDTFVGVDKDSKQAYIINYDECDKTIFDTRGDALEVVKEAEKYKKEFTIDKSEE
mgnify:CR=1 FL=1